MISVLLSTRGRVRMLREAIGGLTRNARTAESHEVLLFVDSDDAETLTALPTIEFTRAIVGPRSGAHGGHYRFNELCKISRGDWLMTYGDDCEVVTPGWDDIINSADASIPNRLLASHDKGENACFPIISRVAYEEIGCYSHHYAYDTWLDSVFNDYPGAFTTKIPVHILNKIVSAPPLGKYDEFLESKAETLGRIHSLRDKV